MVSDELLKDPNARELHEYLKEWKSMRVDKVQYKWSEFQGRVYLQRCCRHKQIANDVSDLWKIV